MNKKQLITAWAVAIIIVFICFNPPTYYIGDRFNRRTDMAKTALYMISVLIPGLLLIYTLRNKKK